MSIAMEYLVPQRLTKYDVEMAKLDRLRVIIDAATAAPTGLATLLSRTATFQRGQQALL